MESTTAPPQISALVHLEFEQAIWLEVFRRINGQANAFSESNAQSGLAAFESDLERGAWSIVQPDWESVIDLSKRLLISATPRTGIRLLDAMHVVTAQSVSAREFLTFDVAQSRFATVQELITPFQIESR